LRQLSALLEDYSGGSRNGKTNLTYAFYVEHFQALRLVKAKTERELLPDLERIQMSQRGEKKAREREREREKELSVCSDTDVIPK